jgi:hypothetical protein
MVRVVAASRQGAGGGQGGRSGGRLACCGLWEKCGVR